MTVRRSWSGVIEPVPVAARRFLVSGARRRGHMARQLVFEIPLQPLGLGPRPGVRFVRCLCRLESSGVTCRSRSAW